jgi:hypothetical protein
VRAAGYRPVASKAWEVQVSGPTSAGGVNSRPDVAMDAAGDSMVVWDEDADANGFFNIGLKTLTAAGTTRRAQTTANAAATGQQRRGAVAATFNGEFAVAWEDDRSGAARVFARAFDAAGRALYADHPATEEGASVNEGEPVGAQSQPGVGIDDQQNVVVSWSEVGYSGHDAWVRGFNPDGTTAGRLPAIRISPFTTFEQTDPALAVSPFGEVWVSYADDADGNGFDQLLVRTGFANAVW